LGSYILIIIRIIAVIITMIEALGNNTAIIIDAINAIILNRLLKN